ncbi:MAG: putative quinol monooxygenase [Myxococcota bacterium]|nr:antibiotic biosynthesis monooxygenase [Myxococcales bacterium]
MFAFVTHMRAKPGKREELRRLNLAMQAATAREPGVPVYVFHTAADSPDDFYYYDLYESQEAYDAHCATPEFQHMMRSFGAVAELVSATKLVPFGPVKSEPVGGGAARD